MPRFEYKVVPAPGKAQKVKGIKTTEGRFAHALTEMMNELGADGWEYVRADALPCEERSGLTKRTTTTQNMLVFRRVIEEAPTVDAVASVHFSAPEPEPAPYRPEPVRAAEPEPVRVPMQDAAPRHQYEPEPIPQPQPNPQPQREPEPAMQLDRSAAVPIPAPTFRATKQEPREPVFSHSGDRGAPRLGGVRHQDDR